MMIVVTEMIPGTSEMTDGEITTGTAMINVIIREEMLRGTDETTTGETEVVTAIVEEIVERTGMKERLTLARHPRALVMVRQGHLQVVLYLISISSFKDVDTFARCIIHDLSARGNSGSRRGR